MIRRKVGRSLPSQSAPGARPYLSKEATPRILESQELDKKVCIRVRIPWDCNSITRETIGSYLNKQGFRRVGNTMTWLGVPEEPDVFIERLKEKTWEVGLLCQFRRPPT